VRCSAVILKLGQVGKCECFVIDNWLARSTLFATIAAISGILLRDVATFLTSRLNASYRFFVLPSRTPCSLFCLQQILLEIWSDKTIWSSNCCVFNHFYDYLDRKLESMLVPPSKVERSAFRRIYYKSQQRSILKFIVIWRSVGFNPIICIMCIFWYTIHIIYWNYYKLKSFVSGGTISEISSW